MTVNTQYYKEHWLGENYIKATEDIFAQVDAYLGQGPKRILDIGCGYANVSRKFQEKYGSELWLLDGDMATNPETSKRVNKFGPVDDFQFYTAVDDLKTQWDRQGMQYTFVDANNINIPEDVKFDFVCSWISCGFHYPGRTRQLLVKE
jgi:SAM-dependent methyltransferase